MEFPTLLFVTKSLPVRPKGNGFFNLDPFHTYPLSYYMRTDTNKFRKPNSHKFRIYILLIVNRS